MGKTVTIKRRPNTTNLPDHVYASSKKRIGSSYTSRGTINTGLTRDETNKYMPEILYIDVEDRAFKKEVNRYFMDLSVEVPAAGLDLEIGLDKDGYPVNLEEYIKYRFVCVHPYVLVDPKSDIEKRKKRKYSYFIEDHAKEQALKVSAREKRAEALKAYIKASNDESKTEMILRVLGEYPDNMDKDTKINRLEELALEDPFAFLKVAGNKDLEVRAFIRKCLSAEVIRKVGNTYLEGEEVLGNSEDEVVLYLNDKKNSETLLMLKSKLKEFTK